MLYPFNDENILMLALSENEVWCVATTMRGFRLWSVDGRQSRRLVLPNTVRNVYKKRCVSSSLVLSAGDKYAVAGIRKELYIWNVETEQLSKEPAIISLFSFDQLAWHGYEKIVNSSTILIVV